ncbi:hypothetical protein [Breoghania sp.]|uniref:hypothetical protein n=1 Tax=Breoghania sp. TaxID=2065378 RepID=UPI002601DC3A|nr:hypothetical protein [Breoghania sp.]MDJ0933741.1 hypothetical protein [Breoghania sp.]
MFLKEVQNYKRVKNLIPTIIENSNLTGRQLAKKLNINEVTFYKKKRVNSFKIDEVEAILKNIDTDKIAEKLLLNHLSNLSKEPSSPVSEVYEKE